MTLPRGRAHSSGKHAQVVNYRHVIHALAQEADGALEPRLSRPAFSARGVPAHLRRFRWSACQTGRPAASWSIFSRSPTSVAAKRTGRCARRRVEAPTIARHGGAARQVHARSRAAAQRRRHPGAASVLRGPPRRQPDGRRRMSAQHAHRRRKAEPAPQRTAPAGDQNVCGRNLPRPPTRKAGPPPAFSPRSPSMNSPNATVAASSAISPKASSCPERRSRPSLSRPCR